MVKYESIFEVSLVRTGYAPDSLARQGLYFYRRQPEGYYRGILIDKSQDLRTRRTNYFAYAAISELNIGYLLKGSCELRLIQQIANIPGTGQAELTTRQDGQRWIDQLIDCMELELHQLEAAELEPLRLRMQEARTAAQKYVTANTPVVRHPESDQITTRIELVPALHDTYVRAVDIIRSTNGQIEPDIPCDFRIPSFANPFAIRIHYIVHLLREAVLDMETESTANCETR